MGITQNEISQLVEASSKSGCSHWSRPSFILISVLIRFATKTVSTHGASSKASSTILFKSIVFAPRYEPSEVITILQSLSFMRVDKAVEEKVIRPIQPVHLITNILSMCLFPVIAKPIITGFALDGDKEKYRQYIDERPHEVIAFVKQQRHISGVNSPMPVPRCADWTRAGIRVPWDK